MSVRIKGLVEKLNATTRAAPEAAASLCLSRTHYEIEIEHFLLKLLENQDSDIKRIARHFEIQEGKLLFELNKAVDNLKNGNSRNPSFSPLLGDALSKAWLYGSIGYNAAEIRSGFVILALLAEEPLSRRVPEFSREIQKINLEALRKNFHAIVEGSTEASPISPAVAPGGPVSKK